MGFIPCWGGAQFFYTDAMSICFGVWACLLAKRAAEKRKNRYYWYAGLVWGIGFAIKATVAISMLAVLLTAIAASHWKEWKKLVLLVSAGFLIIYAGVECLWQLSPSQEMEEELGAPLEYWLALGIAGNGSFIDNNVFAAVCIDTPGKDAKREMARAYIKENMGESLSPKRLVEKARYNFASGHFGLTDFHDEPVNFAYKFFNMNDWTPAAGYTAMLTTGYFYAILILGALSCIFMLGRLKKGKTPPKVEFVTQLTIFGLILFLMIWEANNRQLYNHMPWFAMLGAFGLGGLFESKEQSHGSEEAP
ncbi:MAG: glycosyltransferase family 39 protein [Clostridium sp.]|nr:glycosyltransferase family 39 protein [Clostridium sp.]